MSMVLGGGALTAPGAALAHGAGIAHQVLAQNNFGDTESDGIAGPMALLIIVLLAIATVLLVRNMNGHLRRLPERFPSPGEAATRSPAGPATAESAATHADAQTAVGPAQRGREDSG